MDKRYLLVFAVLMFVNGVSWTIGSRQQQHQPPMTAGLYRGTAWMFFLVAAVLLFFFVKTMFG